MGQFTEYQNIPDHKGAIVKTNPFTIIMGPIVYTSEYRLAYEHPMAPFQCLQVGISYLGKSPFLSLVERTDSSLSSSDIRYSVRGFRFQLTYKLYILEIQNKYRFYIGPHFSFSTAKVTYKSLLNSDNYLKATYINYNLLFGYQTTIFTRRMDLDLFAGVGYRNNKWEEHFNGNTAPMDDTGMYYFDGPFKIMFGFNIGFMLK